MGNMQYSYNILVLKKWRGETTRKSWIRRKKEIKSYFKTYVFQTWSQSWVKLYMSGKN